MPLTLNTEWLPVLSFIGPVLTFAMIGFVGLKFASKSHVAALDQRQKKTEDDVAEIRVALERMATREDVGDLRVKLAELGGEMGQVNERTSSVSKQVDAVLHQVGLVQKALHERDKR